MGKQYIYQLQNVTKKFPGQTKEVFKDVWLAFYPGATAAAPSPASAERAGPGLRRIALRARPNLLLELR